MIRIIGGMDKGRRLKTPPGMETRPTQDRVRGALFNAIQFSIEGARFLDVCAGSGAVGIEALSRGAKSATFLEKRGEAIRCIEENLALVKREGSVVRGDALTTLQKVRGPFDFIYIDPPYKELGLLTKALTLIAKGALLAPEGVVFVEIGAKTGWEPPSPFEVEKRRPFGSTTLLQILLPSS